MTDSEPNTDVKDPSDTAPTGEQVQDPKDSAADVGKDPAAGADEGKKPESENPEPDQNKQPTVPEKYELALPKDSTLEAALIDRTAATAKELGLSQEHAQKALDFIAGELGAHQTAFIDSYKPGGSEYGKQEATWKAAALADPEIGGSQEKLDASIEKAQKILGTLGDEVINEFFHKSAYGSHPSVIRLLSRIADVTSEDSFGKGGSQSEGDPLRKMYPTMDK